MSKTVNLNSQLNRGEAPILSCTLITFILLSEEREKGNVNLRFFYLKRILKIWPLYFLLTLIGFTYQHFTDSLDGYGLSVFLYLLILPNYALLSNPLCFQSWSIGVEEQFYLFWPILLKRERAVFVLAMIIVSFFIVRTIPIVYSEFNNSSIKLFKIMSNFVNENRFDNMALGGLLAYIVFLEKKIHISKYFIIFFSILLSALLFKAQKFYFGTHYFIYSIMFAITLYLIVIKDNKTFLEHSVFKYLGRISYGIYMWHVVSITVVIKTIKYFFPLFDFQGFYENITIYILSILGTILLSSLSFELFEKYFLKLKEKPLRIQNQ